MRKNVQYSLINARIVFLHSPNLWHNKKSKWTFSPQALRAELYESWAHEWLSTTAWKELNHNNYRERLNLISLNVPEWYTPGKHESISHRNQLRCRICGRNTRKVCSGCIKSGPAGLCTNNSTRHQRTCFVDYEHDQ